MSNPSETTTTTIPPLPKFRAFDCTGGGGPDKDLKALTLDDAIIEAREWIVEGDWSSEDDLEDDTIAVQRTIELECEVCEIIYRPCEPSISDKVVDYLSSHKASWDEDRRIWGVWAPADEQVAVIAALGEDTVGNWRALGSPNENGNILLEWVSPIDAKQEEDDYAMESAQRHNANGSYTDPEPDCPVDEGWDFCSPYSLVGGIKENPGVWSGGGTIMGSKEVCRNTGIYRTTTDPGCQRNSGEPLNTKKYSDADEASLAWVKRYHADKETGRLPDWLASYLGIDQPEPEAEANEASAPEPEPELPSSPPPGRPKCA